ASVPRLDTPPGSRLTPIPGLPPDLSALPPGCPFQPRCDRATGVCSERYPEAQAFAPTQRASCFNPVETP
ncbi:MAG TPA: oligopeptide/dipeptide ABC transporter ATP-binding protein, partial [Myxococcota bacterium]|nr:oligopeptide/dipeptide ABC transporter ATP-binding protein [Myxococcota bacterium]